jgi:hypothetical protein
MTRLFPKRPRPLAFHCPRDGPPPVLRAVLKAEVDPFWTPFQKHILDGPKNNGSSFFETAKTTCVSLSPRWSPARFEGRSENRGRPVLDPVSGNFQNGFQNGSRPVFSNGQVLLRFIVRQTGHDPFWRPFHRLSDGS